VSVSITVHRWTRIVISDGTPHPHSFIRDGTDTRSVQARIPRGAPIEIESGFKNLLLLKSTGSQFYGYIKDEYTTLHETWDRVLSTSVDCVWTWALFADSGEVEAQARAGGFDEAWQAARDITVETFAEESSASVQDTTYKMGGLVLDAARGVEKVTYKLPNKHYFEIGRVHKFKNND
jgi:urate oxidase